MAQLREGQGRIVFTGSITGRLAPPFAGLYSASKAGLEALASTLRMELRPWNIRVSVLICGSVKTPIWQRGKAIADRVDRALPPQGRDLYGHACEATDRLYDRIGKAGIPAENVARVVARALTATRPKARFVVGRDAKLYGLLLSILPVWLSDWIMARKAGI
jgi:NAD(P)-dependent dehydrogenase (short-subunit alcohol dehydrogenase family)